MAKRTIRNTDSSETTAPERRRRPRVQDQNGANEAARRPTRARRQAPASTAAAAEPGSFTMSALVTDDELGDLPHEQIAVRAYHIYLERGGQPGYDFQDWITAERELRAARDGR